MVIELNAAADDGADARWGYACDLPLASDRALLVTGSLFAHPQDRSLLRQQIWPVQVILDGAAYPVPFFMEKGELGVSSFAFAESDLAPTSIFYTTGIDLVELKLDTRETVSLGVPGLLDAHELSYADGWVHIANTGNDEVVAYHVPTRQCRRISLCDSRVGVRADHNVDGDRCVDRFHANQVFRGLDGGTWVLVHHLNGWQRMRTVMGEMLKRHGDGGVINLNENRGVMLNLSGPHSVRVVRGEYWVMNSGRFEVNVYSPQWQRLRTFASLGWGRGMATDGDTVYGGMSPRRKRYLSVFERLDPRCWLQAFRATTGEALGQVVIHNMEQINNVYCVDRAVARSLLSLSL